MSINSPKAARRTAQPTVANRGGGGRSSGT
jgi:hypothetical protein